MPRSMKTDFFFRLDQAKSDSTITLQGCSIFSASFPSERLTVGSGLGRT